MNRAVIVVAFDEVDVAKAMTRRDWIKEIFKGFDNVNIYMAVEEASKEVLSIVEKK
jgi:hypothetical protein